MPKVDDYGYQIERTYDTDTFYQGYVKWQFLWFRHRKNFRNDESDSYVPDYEELEVVTEVVTEVSLSAELKGYRHSRESVLLLVYTIESVT